MSFTPDDVRAWIEESTQGLPGALADETVLDGLAGWDSMGMVMFMGLVRDRAALELSVYDLRECKTVGELARAIHARGSAAK